MLDWRILAVTVSLLLATFQTLSKFLPKGTSVFLVNAYASAVGFFLMLTLHLLTATNKSVFLNTKSTLLAIGIGLLIGLANYGVIKAYSIGAPQSIFTPILYVVVIVYGILFGFLLWHEKIDLFQFLGILLSVVGIIIIIHTKK